MKKIDVCFSPELIHQFEITDRCVVVIDVLRATSCMVAGLGSGVDSVTAVESVEACEALGKKGYIMAGERGGQKLPQFDIGNSPFDYMDPSLRGRKVAATTTNGTRCIELSKGAKEVIIGAFLNLSSVVHYLKNQRHDVLLFCAGWQGKFNLEDSLFAGAVCNGLSNYFILESDSALAAKSLYGQHESDIPGAISNSAHAHRLGKFGIQNDIEFCSSLDKFQIVPFLKEEKLVPDRVIRANQN